MDYENGIQLTAEDEAKLDLLPTIMQEILQFASNMEPKRTDEVLALMRNLLTNDVSVDQFVNDLETIIEVQLQDSIVVDFLNDMIGIVRKGGISDQSLRSRFAELVKEEKPRPSRSTAAAINAAASGKIRTKSTFFPPVGEIDDAKPNGLPQQRVAFEETHLSSSRQPPWQGFNPFLPIGPENQPPMANQFPAIVAQKLRSRKRKVAKKKSMQVSPTLVVKVEPKSDPVGEFSTRDPFDQSSNVQSSDAGILTPQQFVYAWTAMQMEWLSLQANLLAMLQFMQQHGDLNSAAASQLVPAENTAEIAATEQKFGLEAAATEEDEKVVAQQNRNPSTMSNPRRTSGRKRFKPSKYISISKKTAEM